MAVRKGWVVLGTSLMVVLLAFAGPVSAGKPEKTQDIHSVDSTIRDAEGDYLLSDGGGTYDANGGFGSIFDVYTPDENRRDRFFFLPKGNRSISVSHEALGGTVFCDSNWASYPFFSSSANRNWFNELTEDGDSTTGFMYVQCSTGQQAERVIRAYTVSGTDATGQSVECATATRVDAATYSFEVGPAELEEIPWPDGLPQEIRDQLPSNIRKSGCPVYLYEDTRASHRENYTTTFLGRFSAPMQVTAVITGQG